MAKRIYLDYASITPIDKRVAREIEKYSSSEYANPSSIYTEGVMARKVLEDCRSRVASHIHAHSDEIIFTSGGTEANNLAIEGTLIPVRDAGHTKPHLIISNIEHSSIMECANILEKRGVEVTRLKVNNDGVISTDELKKSIKPNTYLVSVMTVNNEIGTLQPIKEISKIIRWARTNITKSNYPLFHTDACQAFLYNDLNVEQSGVDLLTLDSSKVYGPRGVGVLYVRRGTSIDAILHGGGQEDDLRSGTENIPGIAGFAKAIDIASYDTAREIVRLNEIKEMFMKGLRDIGTGIVFNPGGSPHILNISINDIDNEYFVLQMDAAGVSVSTKSSCLRDSDESYVLRAIGANSIESVRFSFGRFTKRRDIKRVLRIIAKILNKS